MKEEQITIIEAQTTNFVLENFEGPLDLLLEIIKTEKLDVKTIRISQITEQYLAVMSQASNLDLDRASSFIIMAAMLIEIKSKSVLPSQKMEEEVVEESEEQLLLQIQEYQLFKEFSEKLAKMENVSRFHRAPDETAGNFRLTLGDVSLQAMLDSFGELLKKNAQREQVVLPKQIKKDKFTINDRIVAIKDLLTMKNQVRFLELFNESTTRGEMIATFLAILELLKAQYVTVCQEEVFGEIIISLKEGEQNEKLG